MSPFTQLQSAFGHKYNYGNGIDRDFSPLLHYIDEFDRHFSHRHRFVNCFIPRFDLEEDDGYYYLYGDIPGSTVEDITVELSNDRTLVVFGKTSRQGPALEREAKPEVGRGVDGTWAGAAGGGNYGQESQQEQNFEPPPTRPVQDHPHHLRHTTVPFNFPSNSDTNADANAILPLLAPNSHRILLSERLTGDFTRTFAFPSAVNEDGVRASMENGVLSLIIPKKLGIEEGKKRGVKIPILKGGWWKAENGLHGENEVKARGGVEENGKGIAKEYGGVF